MPTGRQYVWIGASGADFSIFSNWSPRYPDDQAPGDDDLAIFNAGGTRVVNGQHGRVAEIDVVLGTTLSLQGTLEATGSLDLLSGKFSGVALSVDGNSEDGASGVIVGSGAVMIGIGAVDVIGFKGPATLLVTAGGSMDDSGMVLGDRPGGSGTATVTGAGSTLAVANNLPGQPNGMLIVGNAGTGALAVTNGAWLGSSFATLGEQLGSTGAATLDNAAWSGGLFTIGKAGTGSLAVQSGGVLTTVQMVIGGDGTGSVAVQSAGVLSAVEMTIGATGTLEVSATLGSPGTVTDSIVTLAGGTIDVTQGGIMAVGATTGPTGAVLIDNGAEFTGIGTLNGNVVLHGTGVLQATGTAPGELTVSGDLTGSGTAEPLMTLDLHGAVAAGVALAFTAPTAFEPGVLVLPDATAEDGTISGFTVGNTIELPGLHFNNAVFTPGTSSDPGTLVLSGGTETPLSLTVAGDYAPADFIATDFIASFDTLAASGLPGTAITLACFVTGTRIATDEGALAVERLQVGMRVRTEFAGLAPVRWIGHREVDCRRHPDPSQVWPVRVHAGAFGEGRPQSDLWLSPDHAVFIGGDGEGATPGDGEGATPGVLIPIRYLVNGRTVAQEPRDTVGYWHLELDRHDVLFAEGLACESYLDTGNRGGFANGGAVIAMAA